VSREELECRFIISKTVGYILVAKMEQQTHQVVEIGRDLWRSSGPACLLRQSHLEPVAHDHVQMAFEYLQGWRLRSCPGQAVLSHIRNGRVFADVQTEPPVFRFVPVVSCPVTGHH